MNEEFNLSDKIVEEVSYNYLEDNEQLTGSEFIYVEDVKEFIRLLKEYVDNIRDNYGCHDCVIYGQPKDKEAPCWHEFICNISKEIDKLAGEKLK